MNEWTWNGARWWKFDFHAHTPASSDYGKGSQQQELRQQSPKDWLLAYMRAEVDCVAVTDHNSGDWIDRLKTAIEELKADPPSDYRELFLFPGMEISVHGGIHLLAIFDPSKTSSDIDALRGAVGYQGTPGGSDGVTLKSFVEAVGEITSAGGISIPAHVDGENGLFQLPGTTLQQALDRKDIFAMELNNLNAQKPQTYLDNHLIYDLIVTQLREVKRRRQVIVVTHNANIVVNGDAELVVALAARGRETQQECEGSLQEQQVRDTICEVMEGGREAFEDRYRRIALGARHV